MTAQNVLITDYVDPLLLTGLRRMGFHTTYAPEMSRAEMSAALPDYQGVVINTRCALDRPALEKCPDLAWIARLGSGLDIIDLATAGEKGIHVLSAPEGNAEAVAEHAMGMLLTLCRKLLSADQSVRDGEWLREQHRGWEIAGKTIGIIGHGNNGSAFGRLWKGWNVRVLAYDKYLEHYGTDNVTEASLEQVMHESDILSLHIPLTEETANMIDAGFLQQCKKGFVLINTSRGKVVNLSDLRDALATGQVGGACLDVLPAEPPSSGNEKLINDFADIAAMSNVVLTPHIAGWTIESKQKIASVLLEKIKALYA